MQGEFAARPRAGAGCAWCNTACCIHQRFLGQGKGDTTVYVDSAASSHMVSDESFISKHVVEKAICSVRIKGSCGTSSAFKKGTLKFGT